MSIGVGVVQWPSHGLRVKHFQQGKPEEGEDESFMASEEIRGLANYPTAGRIDPPKEARNDGVCGWRRDLSSRILDKGKVRVRRELRLYLSSASSGVSRR